MADALLLACAFALCWLFVSGVAAPAVGLVADGWFDLCAALWSSDSLIVKGGSRWLLSDADNDFIPTKVSAGGPFARLTASGRLGGSAGWLGFKGDERTEYFGDPATTFADAIFGSQMVHILYWTGRITAGRTTVRAQMAHVGFWSLSVSPAHVWVAWLGAPLTHSNAHPRCASASPAPAISIHCLFGCAKAWGGATTSSSCSPRPCAHGPSRAAVRGHCAWAPQDHSRSPDSSFSIC